MDDLYKDTIIDLFKHPHNVGWIESKQNNAVHYTKAHNTSCGDMFELSFQVENSTIVEVLWKGTGCAISTASMSLVSDWMKGKTLAQLHALNEQDILDLFGIDQITTGREKCIFLPLRITASESQ